MQRYRSIYLWSILLVFLFSAQAFSWSDGVWKPSDYSNNFWIQTYTTGSSLIIVSADGERFYVFLDPDVSDGFDVPELFGKDASLEVVFGQVGTSVERTACYRQSGLGDCGRNDAVHPATNLRGRPAVLRPWTGMRPETR